MKNLSSTEYMAYALGVMACVNGLKCAPALDRSVLVLIEGKKPGDSVPILDAWIAGWTFQNING
jgi:hypothetical protein